MEWKPIKGYEGIYEVSDEGEVRSLDRPLKTSILHVSERIVKGKILKQNAKQNGYKTVDLCIENKPKTTLVHRLVADAFMPIPDNLRFVNHKDSNRANNAASNLEWVTSSENRLHGMRSGNVRYGKRKVLCVETGQLFDRVGIAAEWVRTNYPERARGQARVTAHNILTACTGRTPKAYGFTWKYHEGSTTIPKGSRGKRPEMGGSSKEDEDIV